MKTLRVAVGMLLLGLLAPAARAYDPNLVSLVTNGLSEPYGMTVDPDYNVYLSDNSHRVFRYTPDNGTLKAIAGQKGLAGSTNGPGFLARLSSPKGLALYAGGLMVADSGNHCLRLIQLRWTNANNVIFDVNTNFAVVTNFAPLASIGPAGPASATPVPAAVAQFNGPLGLTVAGESLYVADSKNNAIRRVYPMDGVHMVETLRVTFDQPATGFFEPSAVAVDTNTGVLYVSDTRNHLIRRLKRNPDGSYLATGLAGSMQRAPGTNDAYLAMDAQFNFPVGLCWDTTTDPPQLLVSDSGNHTVRRVYPDEDLSAFFGTEIWSVATFIGVPRQAGWVDGALALARLKTPMQIAPDGKNGFFVADSGNGALRRLQAEAPQAPVPDPTIGYIVQAVNSEGKLVTQLVPIAGPIYDDSAVLGLAIKGESNTIHFTYAVTPPVPDPRDTNSLAPNYLDGESIDRAGDMSLNIAIPVPEMTIKAVGSAPGRRSSAIKEARVVFQVSTPSILGNNPRSFTLRDLTPHADIYYETSPVGKNQFTNRRGPFPNNTKITEQVWDDIDVRVFASRSRWKDSEAITNTLYLTNSVLNYVSLGFADGEASSDFVGSPGQRFFAPVTLTVLPNQPLYTFQFNAQVGSLGSAPPVAGSSLAFNSMLYKPLKGVTPVTYTKIVPAMYLGDAAATNITAVPVENVTQVYTNSVTYINGIPVETNYFLLSVTNWSTNYVFSVPTTNTALVNQPNNLLMVGWIERQGYDTLYTTVEQDLITYTMAHNRMLNGHNGKAYAGAFSFVIPELATSDHRYQLQLGRPSGTSDGVDSDVYFATPTNGSWGLEHKDDPSRNTKINSLKHLTIGSRSYLVGDSAPFRWVNAGDFGDTNLLNNDVIDVFQAAIYEVNRPLPGSDFFDAMDSADNQVPADPSDGSDERINQMALGDGVLDVNDVFVTYRRSLDPSLKWCYRHWESGHRVPVMTNVNTFRGGQSTPARRVTFSAADLPAEVQAIRLSTAAPAVRFLADDVRTGAGRVVEVPIRAQISGRFPLRVVLLNLDVTALDGAPVVTQPLEFIPASGLGAPAMRTSSGPANYAAVWLDTAVAGVWGDSLVGTLRVALPADAPPTAHYRVEFARASGSPDGLGLLPRSTQPGLISLNNVAASSWGDGIPDSWRLRYFGSLWDARSEGWRDPDGDGVANADEWRSGTDPLDATSVLRLSSRLVLSEGSTSEASRLVLRWRTVAGKRYCVEASSAASPLQWTTFSNSVSGTGEETEFSAPLEAPAQARYYRVRQE